MIDAFVCGSDVFGDDRLHRARRAWANCSSESVRRSPDDDRMLGDDVGLAERRAARLGRRRSSTVVPPTTSAGIEGQVRLAGQLLAERVEDPGRLEDRPVADVRAEDLRRVRRLAVDRQRPGRRPSAADDRVFGSPAPSSNPIATSAPFAAATSAARASVLRLAGRPPRRRSSRP